LFHLDISAAPVCAELAEKKDFVVRDDCDGRRPPW
jgi:hypothetical protein